MVSTQLTNNPQVGYFSTIDRSCDWMRDQCVESFKDERKRRRSKAPKGTEQMDGNVLLLLFDVFSFGHLLCLTLKWRHAFQERSGEICYSNKTRLPTWTFGIIPKKNPPFQNFRSWGPWNCILHIFGYVHIYIYMVLSSPIEQPVASVGSFAAKNHCSAPFWKFQK